MKKINANFSIDIDYESKGIAQHLNLNSTLKITLQSQANEIKSRIYDKFLFLINMTSIDFTAKSNFFEKK